MARWRLSTRGSDSPAVGGDYIRDSYHTNHTHMSSGLSDLIGDNYKMRQEVDALDRAARSSRERLSEQGNILARWRLIAIICAALLVLSVGLWKYWPHQVGDSTPVDGNSGASFPLPAQPETTAPTPPRPLVTMAVPTCAAGEWITILDSLVEGSKLSEMENKAEAIRAKTTAQPLNLKIGATDTRPDEHGRHGSCPTLGRAVIMLYVGPVNSAAEAARVCQQLGWMTDKDEDRRQCYGKALDPKLKQQTVLPSGTLEDD